MSEIIDVKPEEVAIPVMETDFEELAKIINLVNVADSINIISLPRHVSTYTNEEKNSLEEVIKEILSYYNDQNEHWRIKELKIQPVGLDNDTVRIADKVIYDTNKVIVISKLNSVFIFPGERSIKEGNCSPNEVIRLINLIATKSFLMQFNDVEDEETKQHKLHVNFALIGENPPQNNTIDENQNNE